MTPLTDTAPRARRALSQGRRRMGATSLRAFAQIYLAGHFTLEPSPMHVELFDMLTRARTHRGQRQAVAAPRGHAKSTILTLADVLWSICYDLEKYIMLFSNTGDQASDALSFVKKELSSNPLLLEDFPGVCETPGSRPAPPRWRKDEIITRNGVKVSALGSEKAIRGRRHNQHRPTLIILDDIENDIEVRSDDQRRQKLEWFQRSVLKAGTGHTNVVVVGTVLHFGSLLARLLDETKSPGWTGRVYQAVTSWSSRPELWAQWENIYRSADEFEGASGPEAAQAYFLANEAAMLEGTAVLWPQREDYRELMELRAREGRYAFDAEKQNQPTSSEDALFREEDFQYWDDTFATEDELLRALGYGNLDADPYKPAVLRMYGACDPSMGKAGKNRDDSAIVTVLKDSRTHTLYLLDADIRRRKPDQIIDDIIGFHRRRSYRRINIEAVQFQEFLYDELRKRSRAQGVSLPAYPGTHSSDKIGRIQKLQPLVASGGIRFCRRHVQLMDQLRQFPYGSHDDGPDALEMAVAASMTIEFPKGEARFYTLASSFE